MFVKLKGTPYQNGKKIGLYSKNVLISRIRQVCEIQRIKKIPSSIINARVKDFTSLLSRTCPHWLEEIKGQSDVTGIDTDKLIFLNCLPDSFYSDMPAGFYLEIYQSCSSFVEVGSKRNILFKIRDEKNFPQSFFVLQNKGFLSSQAGRDIGNTGFAHFFNEKFLAGANNTGSFTKHPTERPLLNDCHLMRYIAERAGSVREIPCLIEKLIDGKALGGASENRGAIFLFADSESGLLIECDSQDYTARFIHTGRWVVSNHFTTASAKRWESQPPNKNTITRRKRLKYLLGKKNITELSPEDIFAFSRDRKNAPDSLCNDNLEHFWMTVSVECQFITKNKPLDSINFVCCGNPLHSVYLPIPITYVHTYIPMLDGSFYKATEKRYLKDISCKKAPDEIKKWEEYAIASKKTTGSLLCEAYQLLKTLV